MHRAACGHGDRPMWLWWAVSPPQGLNVAPESCQQDVHDLVTLHRSTESQWKLTKQQKQHKFKVVQLEKLQPGAATGSEDSPRTQPSTVCRPGSAWRASWCRSCAAGTWRSAPGGKTQTPKTSLQRASAPPSGLTECRLRAGPGRSGRPSTGSRRRLAQGRTPSDLKRREPRPAGRRRSSPWPGRMSGVTGSLTETPKQTHFDLVVSTVIYILSQWRQRG